MDAWLNYSFFQQLITIFQTWIQTHIFSWMNLLQFAVLLVFRVCGALLGGPTTRFVKRRIEGHIYPNALLKNFIAQLLRSIPFIIAIILLWVGIQIFHQLKIDTFLMRLVLNLSVAWLVVRLAASVILDKYWSRVITIGVWSLAALNIIGVYGKAISLLNSVGFSIGQTKLTLLSLIQAAIVMVVLLRAVSWLNSQIEQRLEKVPGLNSSTRLMMAKVTHVGMIVLVSIIVLNTVGIDFSSLALFSGAIGVGVGFGLQKVVSNYISGLILLSDRSVKPGDVIQLADAFGWVRFMGSRYVSVVTRDEKEYLIPNEDLITQQVINWSYTNNNLRIKVAFGVSYKSDPHQVIKLVLAAIQATERILEDPSPVCLLTGFGDSSVNFELRFWIKDPQNGISNITSVSLLKIWDVLKANNIEIPFPQRDVHIKS